MLANDVVANMKLRETKPLAEPVSSIYRPKSIQN